jgi:hypothetical protein
LSLLFAALRGTGDLGLRVQIAIHGSPNARDVATAIAGFLFFAKRKNV